MRSPSLIEDDFSSDDSNIHDDISEVTTQDEETEQIAEKQTAHVNMGRSVLYSVVIVLGVAVSATLFCVQRRSQHHQLETYFRNSASHLEQRASLNTVLVGLETLVYDYEALTNWPQVKLEGFTQRAKVLGELVHTESLMLLPIVQEENRSHYEEFVSTHLPSDALVTSLFLDQIPPHIYNESGSVAGTGPYTPVWQTTSEYIRDINLDVLSTSLKEAIVFVKDTEKAVLSGFYNDNVFRNSTSGRPLSVLVVPIRADYSVVGVLLAVLDWNDLLSDEDVAVTLKNSFGQSVAIDTARYDDLIHVTKLQSDLLDDRFCQYTLTVFPSQSLRSHFLTNLPAWYAAMSLVVFMVVFLAIVGFDKLVEIRQRVMMEQAVQSNAILSSLFPEQVRERLFRNTSAGMEDVEADGAMTSPVQRQSDDEIVMGGSSRLKTFLSEHEVDQQNNRPIADLFPHCTVLFADIAGFTSWCSLREPSQVFILLEAIYSAFDSIAKRRGVFKVETIGDSYVAVTGLPDPQEEHAMIMCRFARDCRIKFKEVTQRLELSLGPDTYDLAMRFGIHSGPCTAGVLRGERSRFQLFGDTVNTAARMESTGERDRIQLSQTTADQLISAGKGHWICARDKLVNAKGKGALQTFWLEPPQGAARRSSLGSLGSDCSGNPGNSSMDHLASTRHLGESVLWGTRTEISDVEFQRNKHQRLIDFVVDLLMSRLKLIVARRRENEKSMRRGSQLIPAKLERPEMTWDTRVIDEVVEVIRLPQFDAKKFADSVDPDSIEIDPEVASQLKRYVTVIAAMYRANPFHNWEHACHVTMSVNKLLQRVVTPEISHRRHSVHMNGAEAKTQVASALHHYTYGITSDPLTQFAVVFGAIIHDVDHFGVSNGQLVKEFSPLAEKYHNKSILEQNSVDLAWDLLMDNESYGALQQLLFPNESELKRFRQVLVNAVCATDIFDKELSDQRKERWAKAFQEGAEPDEDNENRKATIVIEHLIQASDVAHTMQHWHIYQRWNRRLFDEMYTAHRAGRMEADPSKFWYTGELKFFDTYVIPLAKKLKDCGVFGVASDECLNYAMLNRNEWEAKGEMVVSELLASYSDREKEERENTDKKPQRGRFARRRSLITTGG